MTFHFEFQAEYKQSCEEIYKLYHLDMQRDFFFAEERVNKEKAEYRRVKQRRSRKEEQKEKLQNRADIRGKSANIQFFKLRKL